MQILEQIFHLRQLKDSTNNNNNKSWRERRKKERKSKNVTTLCVMYLSILDGAVLFNDDIPFLSQLTNWQKVSKSEWTPMSLLKKIWVLNMIAFWSSYTFYIIHTHPQWQNMWVLCVIANHLLPQFFTIAIMLTSYIHKVLKSNLCSCFYIRALKVYHRLRWLSFFHTLHPVYVINVN